MVTGLGRAQAPPKRTSIFPDSPCSQDGTQGEKPEIGGIISLQREFFKGFGPEDRFSAWDLYSTSANAWMAVLACPKSRICWSTPSLMWGTPASSSAFFR